MTTVNRDMTHDELIKLIPDFRENAILIFALERERDEGGTKLLRVLSEPHELAYIRAGGNPLLDTDWGVDDPDAVIGIVHKFCDEE